MLVTVRSRRHPFPVPSVSSGRRDLPTLRDRSATRRHPRLQEETGPMSYPNPGSGPYPSPEQSGWNAPPAPAYAPPAQMGIGEAVSSVLSKYATFTGRARRSEYWWFYLAYVLAYVVAAIVDAAGGVPDRYPGRLPRGADPDPRGRRPAPARRRPARLVAADRPDPARRRDRPAGLRLPGRSARRQPVGPVAEVRLLTERREAPPPSAAGPRRLRDQLRAAVPV